MKTNTYGNPVVAQSAAAWREKQLAAEEEQRQKKVQEQQRKEQESLDAQRREEERQKFEARRDIWDVISRPYVTTEYQGLEEEPWYPYNEYSVYNYVSQIPSDEILRNVAEYADHAELMAVIKGFNCYVPESDANTVYQGYRPSLVMPQYLQDLIARRGNQDEIRAFCQKQGFGATGQDALLERGNHEELMWYLERHGFLLEQQKKLIKRGNIDEIRMHIKHHGLAPELMDELIAEMKSGQTKNFYKFIALREFPESHQKALLEVMSFNEFYAYIERHGFWESILPDLVNLRSDDELIAYVKKHHYLGHGVNALATHTRALIELYLNERPSENWLYILTSVKNLDYELLTKVFSQVPACAYLSETELQTISLFRNGSHKDVMAFLKAADYLRLNDQTFAELFFRNNPEELNYYLDNHLHKYYGRTDN